MNKIGKIFIIMIHRMGKIGYELLKVISYFLIFILQKMLVGIQKNRYGIIMKRIRYMFF